MSRPINLVEPDIAQVVQTMPRKLKEVLDDCQKMINFVPTIRRVAIGDANFYQLAYGLQKVGLDTSGGIVIGTVPVISVSEATA